MDADPLFLTLYSYFYTSICWEASGHVVSMIKRKHFSIRIASVVRFHDTRTIVYISSLCLHLCPLCYLIALRISPPLCWARFFFWWVGRGGGGGVGCYTVMKAWEHSGIADQTLPHRDMQIVSHYKHSTNADIMKWVFMKTLISNTVLAFIYLLFPCCERNMGNLTTLMDIYLINGNPMQVRARLFLVAS